MRTPLSSAKSSLYSLLLNGKCLRGMLQETFSLLLYNVGSLRAFLAVDDVERYLLTLVESLEALALNCAEVNEYVLAVIYGDESVPFALVEPFYGTLCH